MDVDDRTLASVAAYDANAPAYHASLRLRRPLTDVRRFADMAKRHELVLDVGCGPANDLRLLRDAGVHPVGIDLAFGALRQARMLLPRHPLVQAPLQDPPFQPRSFGGLWMSGALTNLPRSDWRPAFGTLLGLLESGPVYLSCYRGTRDMVVIDDEVVGRTHVSEATEAEVEALLRSQGLTDVSVEVRPDPILDRRRLWVVALGRYLG